MKDLVSQAREIAAKKMPRRSRRGYSIVEIGLVLIVVALLIAAVIVAFYQVQTNAKQTQLTNIINETYSATQDLYRTSSSYGADGDDIVAILESAQSIPPIARRDPDGTPDSGDEAMTHPFDGAITVVAGGDVGSTGETFTITMAGMTRANCIDFMTNYVDRGTEQSGFVGASSAGTAFAFPLTVPDVQAGCAAGDLALEYR